jgi:hemerythrin-like domain-containing protein
MLRDKNLIPLSRQHQHALALCVRINRAQPIAAGDLSAWQAEMVKLFEQEIKIHFAAEEHVLFPVARRFAELTSLVDEFANEHDLLRQQFSKAESRRLSGEDLPQFARRLSDHIRKEERMMFERLQALLSLDEMAKLGLALEDALKEASAACSLPVIF